MCVLPDKNPSCCAGAAFPASQPKNYSDRSDVQMSPKTNFWPTFSHRRIPIHNSQAYQPIYPHGVMVQFAKNGPSRFDQVGG
jgi:hypothetical protein